MLRIETSRQGLFTLSGRMKEKSKGSRNCSLKEIRSATDFQFTGANLHRGRASVIALGHRQIALATT